MGISRDEICSQRIGLIADMGSMEEELTVFGYCYLENGKLKYRVSSSKEELYQFLLQAAKQPLFPTPVHQLTVRQLIPTGGKDELLYQVKKQLAQTLRVYYPAEFFQLIKPFIEQESTNQAWPFIQQLQEDIEGVFVTDELDFFESLLLQCYQKKLLDQQHKQLAWNWLLKNRNQMDGDTVVKEKNKRTFYGFLYLQEADHVCTKVSMELDRVIDEKIRLEHDGIIAGPVLKKTFWYHEQQQLPKLRGKFETWLQTISEERIKHVLPKIQVLSPAIDLAAYQIAVLEAQHLPPESQFVLQWYGRVWNVNDNI